MVWLKFLVFERLSQFHFKEMICMWKWEIQRKKSKKFDIPAHKNSISKFNIQNKYSIIFPIHEPLEENDFLEIENAYYWIISITFYIPPINF